MSKKYNRAVEVRLKGDVLVCFFWQGKWLKVESVSHVRVRRDAFDPYYGLATFRAQAGGGTYDLVATKEGWVLERVWD